MIYRDHKTGRFASKATWKRAKARGSKRYKRERPKPKPKKKTPGERTPIPKVEYALKFDYGTKKKHNVIDSEVHLFGPAGATKAEVRAIYEGWWKNGKIKPGWQVRAISWRSPRGRWKQTTKPEEVRKQLAFVLQTKPRSIDIP